MLEHTTITEYNKELVKTINELRNRIDYLERIEKLNFSTGTWASRPAAPLTNELLFATDYGQLNYYDGSSWNPVQATNYVSPNYATNSAMEVAQRTAGAPATGQATGVATTRVYGVDRFFGFMDGGGGWTLTASQQTFATGTTNPPNEPANYLRLVQSGTQSAGTFNILEQRIEDVRTLAGRTVTFTFFARSNSGSNVTLPSITLFQFFGGGSPSSSVITTLATNQVVTTTWTRYSYTVTLPNLSGITLGSDHSLILVWNMPLNGTGYQFELYGVQLEAGPVATPYRKLPYDIELQRCQRFYQSSAQPGVTPAQNMGRGNGPEFFRQIAGAVAQSSPTFPLCPTLRASPVLTTYNLVAANAQVQDLSVGAGCTLTTGFAVGSKSFMLTFNGPAAGAAWDVMIFGWSVDADVNF
jgi:hypothetical protein